MKTINKISALLFIIVAMIFVSCEEEIVREPSPEANPSSNKVYFPKQSSSIILGLEGKSFEVTIAREVTTSALTVNLKLSSGSPNFSIPSSVAFAAGEGEKVFNVAAEGLELLKKYIFSIEVADVDQTDPYTKTDKYSVIALNVLKEDFAPFAEGNYWSEWYEEEWPVTLEYSPATESYRFKNWLYTDNLLFKWDGGSKVTFPGTGTYTIISSGDVHPSYGPVSAYFHNTGASYDDATKTFEFLVNWRVSAGTFGSYPDYYEVSKFY